MQKLATISPSLCQFKKTSVTSLSSLQCPFLTLGYDAISTITCNMLCTTPKDINSYTGNTKLHHRNHGYLWSKSSVGVLRGAKLSHLGSEFVELFVRAAGLLQTPALPFLKLLLHLLNIGNGMTDKLLIEVIQSVVHLIVEGLATGKVSFDMCYFSFIRDYLI